jgi:hypothetical protein
MFRRVFRYFLVFLLVSSVTDDLVASLTPDPADDFAAAADNEFLFETTRDDHAGRQSPLPSFPEEPARTAFGFSPGFSPPRLVRTPDLTFLRPDPLYCLMSLQR